MPRKPGHANVGGENPAGRILERLHKVRSIGAGRWKACCPAHEDRSPSLAVRELEDGRVLLHCFAGCDVASVVSALGLGLEDLFPQTSPAEVPKVRRPWAPSELLHFLDIESLVVLVVACDVVEQGRMKAEDLGRVRKARERIANVMRCLPR